jgi:hypothetical protein
MIRALAFVVLLFVFQVSEQFAAADPSRSRPGLWKGTREAKPKAQVQKIKPLINVGNSRMPLDYVVLSATRDSRLMRGNGCRANVMEVQGDSVCPGSGRWAMVSHREVVFSQAP